MGEDGMGQAEGAGKSFGEREIAGGGVATERQGALKDGTGVGVGSSDGAVDLQYSGQNGGCWKQQGVV